MILAHQAPPAAAIAGAGEVGGVVARVTPAAASAGPSFTWLRARAKLRRPMTIRALIIVTRA